MITASNGRTDPAATRHAAAALADLRAVLVELDQVVVGFSGGVDSALLAWVAHDTLGGERATAVTAVSASLAPAELDDCGDLAATWGLNWRTVQTAELADPAYVRNDADRCAHCKSALMEAIEPIVAALAPSTSAGPTVVLGVNTDDLGDHRPGQEAAAERGARFPLVEAGFTKELVREVSRHLELRTWDKPAAACLASRVPYGTPVTVPLLDRVARAEAALHSLGFDELRVRHYNDTARIEVPIERLGALIDHRDEVVEAVRGAGYRYVTVDLEGLRSGNLNAALGNQTADRR